VSALQKRYNKKLSTHIPNKSQASVWLVNAHSEGCRKKSAFNTSKMFDQAIESNVQKDSNAEDDFVYRDVTMKDICSS
jgi:hypothetical protein